MCNRYSFLLCVVALLALVAPPVTADAPPARTFVVAQMSGTEEVPPVLSPGLGAAVFLLSPDGTVLRFQLVVARIDNVFAAHIHTGAVGVNGPVVLGLFDGPPAGGTFNGLLSQGDVVRGVTPLPPSLGATLDNAQRFDVLIAAIRSGNTYVNVHTNDGLPPLNTGAGDMARGEIRGQVIPHP